MITSRAPNDLPEFCHEFIQTLAPELIVSAG